MERLIKTDKSISLGICFLKEGQQFKIQKNNCVYYPVSVKKGFFNNIAYKLSYRRRSSTEVEQFLKVVNDFKPDIIHVFGCEYNFGLIIDKVSIPVVIHIQGLLNPLYNAYFAPGVSPLSYFCEFKLWRGLKTWRNYLSLKYGAQREEKILSMCKYVSGRTQWDRDVVKIYARNSKYFLINEVLRPVFYETDILNTSATSIDKEKVYLASTLSHVTYKGVDLILKAAHILKNHFLLNFEWRVYGIDRFPFWEKKLKINASTAQVNFMGTASPSELYEALCHTDMYIHPSYIDNSPNSVCEAQMLGVPVISTDVGGVRSLIKDGVSGVLVSTNDPHYLSAQIVLLLQNKELRDSIRKEAKIVAQLRHDKEVILTHTVKMYEDILKSEADGLSE